MSIRIPVHYQYLGEPSSRVEIVETSESAYNVFINTFLRQVAVWGNYDKIYETTLQGKPVMLTSYEVKTDMVPFIKHALRNMTAPIGYSVIKDTYLPLAELEK